MNLFHLNSLVQNLPEFRKICSTLVKKAGRKTALNLPEPAYSIFAASIHDVLRCPVLFLSAHPEVAKRRYEQMRSWVQDESSIYYFPEIDLLASTMAVDPLVNSERLRILSLLTSPHAGDNAEQKPPFIIASALSLASRSIGSSDLMASSLEINWGFKIKQSALLEKLQSIGYEYDVVVEVPGTFGKRGGIVDIFPSGREQPVRIEFFGDEVDSIREYDSRTQRSLSNLPSVNISPAKELAVAGKANLLVYLPRETVLILDDILQI
ncbi:MAG: hypothetical protein EHM12_06330, partial [Dehalococcoidia bacterium]